MDAKTKTKVIIFGGLGIVILLIIIIVVSIATGGKKKKPTERGNTTSLVVQGEEPEKFTVNDMIKVNSESEKNEGTGESILSRRTEERDYSNLTSSGSGNGEYQAESKEMQLLQKVLREQQGQGVTQTTTSATTTPKKQVQSVQVVQSTPVTKSVQPVQVVEPVIAHQSTSVTKPVSEPETGKRTRTRTNTGVSEKNLIKACIHGEQTVYNGSTVRMRLLEDLKMVNIIIPKNTLFYGVAKIDKQRMNINVTNLKYGDNIQTVNIAIYDNDAMQGLNLPNNVKEALAKEGTSQGIQKVPGVTGGGIVGDVANAAIGVVKNVASTNVNEIKVTLKSNYNIFIK